MDFGDLVLNLGLQDWVALTMHEQVWLSVCYTAMAKLPLRVSLTCGSSEVHFPDLHGLYPGAFALAKSPEDSKHDSHVQIV